VVERTNVAVLLREFALRATQIARSCGDAKSAEKLDQLSCDLMESAKDYAEPLVVLNP
jgi:hypothetical protein